MSDTDNASGWRQSGVVLGVALALRLIMVAWATGRVPPTADGSFYHVVAQRVAAGDGYTWLWPDGVVTYAAHYPVGYPGVVGGLYAVFGASPTVAMVFNALLGALGCVAMHRVARAAVCELPVPRPQADRAALLGGLLVAGAPTLVAYTPAMMTEGVVAALVALAMWAAIRLHGESLRAANMLSRARGWLLWLTMAFLLGVATLMRPQAVLFAPVLGFLAVRQSAGGTAVENPDQPWWQQWRLSSRLLAGTLVAVGALVVVAPWTLRNCDKMESCVFVSANGGWNLLIGTFPEGRGAWVGVHGDRVPEACREVYQEAAKDQCFRQAGVERVRGNPIGWLALVPSKLRATFDYGDAASVHLREAGTLNDKSGLVLSTIEVVQQRVFALLVLVGVGVSAWRRAELPLGRDVSQRKLGWRGLGFLALFLAGLAAFLGAGAWLGWLLVVLLGALSGELLPGRSVGAAFALWAIVLTTLVHAVFFGAGRYSLPLSMWLAPLLAIGWISLHWLVSGLPSSAKVTAEASKTGRSFDTMGSGRG